MLNRILSKKIKFPLSLRGAFPNVIARERSDRSNLSGFSLIELMVAVTILALAIFGIFHAYSVGFLGMADARDRTVATNYAQEAMEDVKNMDFEKIAPTTKSVINANRKYRIDVNVSLESTNLKKVFTVVSWKNRNGITKTVETSMLVHFIEVFASDAAKIVLFADSYTILNTGIGEGTFTELIAIIKDVKGNTVIDWGTREGEGDITFAITERTDLGYLTGNVTTLSIKPFEGKASTIFTSSGSLGETEEKGYSVIMASVNLPNNGNVSDSVTIKITNGPVKIILSANPDIIKASTSNYSTITVSLCNAANQILKKSELVTDIEITFSVFGEGNLSTSTITIPAVIGDESTASADIILNSTGNPGLVSVVATATDLESDKIDVRFLGPPVSISISAVPNPMYVDDDYSTIYVSLLDENGFNTNPSDEVITISLTLSTDTGGHLEEPYSWNFSPSVSEGIINETTFRGQSFTGTAIITASGGGLIEDFVTINVISALVPDHIKLTASPQIVQPGSTSIITATVYDSSGRIVTNYTGTISFSKTGIGTFSDYDFANGIATITLSSGTAGTAIITVSSSDGLDYLPSGGITVGFYGAADHIILNADRKYVKVGGGNTSTITATVYDSNNIIVLDYDKSITFYKDGIDFSTINFTNGKATIKLSSDIPGTVTIIAISSDDLECFPSGGVEVVFYEETTLTLIEDSAKYYPAGLKVIFKVIAIGEDILVDEMKVSWVVSTPAGRFDKIVINSEEVYTGGNDKSGTIVDIINKTLIAGGEYSIELTFKQNMAEKTITVTFYPYIGSYTVEFIPAPL